MILTETLRCEKFVINRGRLTEDFTVCAENFKLMNFQILKKNVIFLMEKILETLSSLGIDWKIQEHKPIFTVEDGRDVKINLDGIEVKNLFLKDKKGNFVLLTLSIEKKANLKELADFLGSGRLSFCNSDELMKFLSITAGSVSPLCIMSDTENKVRFLLDSDCKGNQILCHPLRNTATIQISCSNLIHFAEHFCHKVTFFECNKN